MSTINRPQPMPHAKRQRVLGSIVCVLVLAALAVVGCSTKPPIEALSRAELNLRTATEARANQLAPVELQRAMDTLEASKRAIAAGNNDQARRLAEVAQAEAELAEVKAEAEIMRLAADNLRRQSDALRQEIERAMKDGSTPKAGGSR